MNKFDLLLLFEDKIGVLMTDTNKVFKTSEIERFLNAAQDKYFAQMAEIFEVNEDARKALTNLVKSETVSAEVGTPAGLVKIDSTSVFFQVQPVLSGELYKIVEEFATIDDLADYPVKPITHDQYHANIENPFKKPYGDLVWRLDIDGYVELVSRGLTHSIDTYTYRYLTSPTRIDFTTDEYAALDLRDKDLKNIVEIAVNMALNSLSVVKPGE